MYPARGFVRVSLFIKKVDEEIERQSLLKHPFYQKWSHGELTRDELAGYSKEYFQMVKIVPGLVSNVGEMAYSTSTRRQIGENVEEEKTHVEPWIKFAGSLGVTRAEIEGYVGAAKTLDSTREIERLTKSSFLEGVAALYAYEKQLPEISRSKIEGLQKHYGLAGGDATRYFEIHEEADVRHAALWRDILERTHGSETSVMNAVVDSLGAQNRLLDSVVENHCNS